MDTQAQVNLALALQERMVDLIRTFGLHQPDRTPCGRPVSVAEVHALMELGRREGLSQHELGAWLRLEKSTVSRLVSGLEASGWVERSRDASDGRFVRLALSEEGRRMATQIAEARHDKFERLLDAIPPSERDRVLGALDTLLEALHAST
ncbi:MAG: MarR family transcriptional regulator [Chloroflexota bacterium]|nr:MarR family transcriptional regulator [Chloroflexota bacterium]